MSDYNGWKNRATWNVALWLNNDEVLYNKVVNYLKRRKRRDMKISWTDFTTQTSLKHMKTPDGYSYLSSEVCKSEMTAMLNEMAKEVAV